jgi:hypothetical protein
MCICSRRRFGLSPIRTCALMITYFVSGSASDTLRNYLAGPGRSVADRVRVLAYDELAAIDAIAPGTSIFAALDQVSPLQRTVLPGIAARLLAAGHTVLNHPSRVLLRFALLRTLYETGRNSFNVYRVDEADKVQRFPVFVRDEHLHNGNLTPLLHNPAELQRGLRDLMLRGRHPAELLIVEFCDTSGSDGIFRKYSAFKVGATIIPRYLQVSQDWMIKTSTRWSAVEALEEDRAYLETNPHEAWLREVFALAATDYGRIDYGMLDGRPQVWEINTNPALGCSPHRAGAQQLGPDGREGLDRLKALFHQRYGAALMALIEPAPGAHPLKIDLPRDVRQHLAAEARRERHRDHVARYVSRVVESAPVQAVKPWLKRVAVGFAPVIARIPRRP